MLTELINQLETDWKDILLNIEKNELSKIDSFLEEEVEKFEPDIQIFPKRDNIFKCFSYKNLSDIKVVILGQDPYINIGEAMGICFSVPNDIKKVPPSLKNIFKELNNEYGTMREKNDLTDWAEQGVLLLNTALSVRQYKSNSHQKIWKKYTDAIIKEISDRHDGVIFILWGNDARKKIELINTERHHVLESVHPSPLSASRGFFGNNHFKKINEILKEKGKEEIYWIS